MTPDQTLRAAILGDAESPAQAQSDTPRKRRKKPSGKTQPTWLQRSIRLLSIALMLLVSGGLMRTPEVKAMLAQASEFVVNVVVKERRARDTAEAAAPTETAAKTIQVAGASSGQSDGAMQDRVSLLSAETDPTAPGSPANASVPTGVVTAIHSANLIDVDHKTFLIDALICPSPDSDKGRLAALGLARLTQGQTVTCDVSGEAGDHAQRANCRTQQGQDLALALRASGLCQ